jgi:hypothetical protein
MNGALAEEFYSERRNAIIDVLIQLDDWYYYSTERDVDKLKMIKDQLKKEAEVLYDFLRQAYSRDNSLFERLDKGPFRSKYLNDNGVVVTKKFGVAIKDYVMLADIFYSLEIYLENVTSFSDLEEILNLVVLLRLSDKKEMLAHHFEIFSRLYLRDVYQGHLSFSGVSLPVASFGDYMVQNAGFSLKIVIDENVFARRPRSSNRGMTVTENCKVLISRMLE